MKRKTINKLLSTVMVAAMSVGLLAGCGGSASTDTSATTPAADNTSATTESSSTGDSTTTTDSGDKVTINVTRATFNLANSDTEQVKKVQDAVNEYIGDKINVQVNLTDIGSGEYTDKANLALANNEINLLWTASWESAHLLANKFPVSHKSSTSVRISFSKMASNWTKDLSAGG